MEAARANVRAGARPWLIVIVRQKMKSRRPATKDDLKKIALGILRREDVSSLVSKVELTEEQRELLRRANAEGPTAWIPTEYVVPAPRFREGGAPGLKQQKR